MSINPLHEFAPFPKAEGEVTAEAFLRYETVQAFAHLLRTRVLCIAAFRPGASGDDMARYSDALDLLAQRIGVLLLLRHLRQHAGEDAADEAAKHLHAVWSDSGVFVEFLHDWLLGFGIDPEMVARAVSEEAQLAARQEAEVAA